MLTEEVDIAGERLLPHPYRAPVWPRMKLLVSDLHLGKAAHFRKAGASLPEVHDDVTLERLDLWLHTFAPHTLLILGDLFHSSHDNSWGLFQNWANGAACAVALGVGQP